MYNVGNRWDNEEGWLFHSVLKNRIRSFLLGSSEKIVIHPNEVKEEWYFGPTEEDISKGATDPRNVEFFKDMIEKFRTEVKEKRIKVPIIWKLWEPVANMLLSVYIQDSAWYERLGGINSFFVLNCQRFDAMTLLKEGKGWYLKYEAREYGSNLVVGAFDKAIQEYPKGKFYTKAIDFFFNYLREHKSEWKISPKYNPGQWYGYGRGQIDLLLGGRGC